MCQKPCSCLSSSSNFLPEVHPKISTTSMSSSEDFSDDDFIVSSAENSPKAKRQKPMPKANRKTPPASNGSSVGNSQNGAARNSTANKVNVSDQYQKLSQLEHILKRPDTYIGSIEKHESEQWIYNKETESMERKVVSIVPGLFKIFDEILVNAADNKIRDPSMKNIEVTIKPEENLIEVKNDGKGIPVQIHDKEHIYIPELIFGNLLTSSNYDDDQKKVTGGRNGYGAKLCNIFSTEFIVETYDKSSGKLYTQRWSQNMGKTDKPVIKSVKKATEYTKVSFRPDLAKFNMTTLDEDILGVLRRRVYDLCGSVRDISVKLNGEKLKIRNFKQYVEMYVKALENKNNPVKTEENSLLPPPSSSPSQTIVYQTLNDRWEVAFAVSDSTFNQVSFVNSIATTSGGTHVNFIADQIVKKIEKEIKTKNKKAMIKPFQIKNNMFLFINCLVENPAFTSQTKEQLTTRASQFGGKKTEVPDDFIKKILRTGIVDAILDIAAMNADKALKKNDGSRKNRITGYPKLEDANRAGTKEGYKCTLILTEGDSASSLAVAGLAVVGRDYYGVYPLRGKMLNVREASADQIMKNAEIQAIKQIMGFQHKKNYTPENINSLRYGHIMIMTDQDHDGSHIKGLIINFLESSFPGLLKVPNFLLEFITPIVKVTITSGPEKRKVIPFYSIPEYEAWREQNTASFKQKYYKGLGTSLAEEMREYFSQLDKHMKTFHALQDVDPGFIDLAFSKKKADDRKEWLRGFEPGVHLDPDLSIIPISDFINKELILFSMADNIRSIPSMMDGFKPSQRKILYGCYKRNLRSEIKVSQLAGYIGEHSAYHHGDQSLIQSIIGLAQDFVGSNNLNLLQPIGGFGSRAQGGKDASAARYIFTDLSKITRKIFHVDDSPLLNYLQDDEQTVEPEWYLPIVPMLLVNGAEGIGTGWSTNIPPFNPLDIVANIRRLMNGQDMEEMIPWYRGWNGSITKISSDKFRMEGNIEQIDDETLVITEIPAKTWTINMKEFLLNGIAGSEKQKSWIKDMEEQHGMDLKFVITLTKEEMKKSLQMGLKERFKLITTINVGNMVAFDAGGKIKKYDNVNEIIEDYYHVRLDYYQRRKDHLAEVLGNQLEKISSQARFVKMIIENELRVNNRKRTELIEELQRSNFPKFSKDGKPIWQQVDQEEITEAEIKVEDEEDEEIDDENLLNPSLNIFASYDYLLGMPIWSLTKERYQKLLLQKAEKEDQLAELLKLSAKQIWDKDLDVFLEEWHAFLKEDMEKRASSFNKSGPAAKKKRVRRVKKENDENDPDFGAKKPNTVKKVLNPKTKPKTTSLLGSLSDITSELDKNLDGFVDLT